MTEEFANFIERINKKPVEEQLSKLTKAVSKMIDIIQRFVNGYNIEVNAIRKKIRSLEARTIDTNVRIPEGLTALPPPPPLEDISREQVRGAIIGELKDLFKKRDGVNNK